MGGEEDVFCAVEEVPVLPLALWGSQAVWQRDGIRSFSFGRPLWLKAGSPLDFSEFDERRDDPAALHKVADTVMEAIVCPEEIRAAIPQDFGRSRAMAWYALTGFGIIHDTAADSRIVMWDSAT